MRRFRRYLRRRTTYLNLAAMRVLWPVWKRLPRAEGTWAQHVRRIVRARRLQRGFDVAWLRVLVGVLALPVFLIILPAIYEGVLRLLPALPQMPISASNALVTAGTVVALFFVAGLTVYFGHLLVRRLQCGLLEWCVIVVLLGNLEGLVLTTPGVMSSPVFAALLGLVVSGTVFYGAVVGLAEIRLTGLAHPLARVAALAVSWWRLAAVPLIVGGCFLAFEEHLPSHGRLVGPKLAVWGGPFIVAGVVGLLLAVVIAVRTRAACRRMLNA